MPPVLRSPGPSLQAEPSGGAAHHQDHGERSALDVVAGGAMNVKEAGMGRAKKTVPLLAILFLAMLSNGERFGHVAKAQTIASVLAAQIRSQGFACDEAQKATRDAKLSKPDYDVWVLTVRMQPTELADIPICRQGGKTEIGDRAPSLRLHRTVPAKGGSDRRPALTGFCLLLVVLLALWTS